MSQHSHLHSEKIKAALVKQSPIPGRRGTFQNVVRESITPPRFCGFDQMPVSKRSIERLFIANGKELDPRWRRKVLTPAIARSGKSLTAEEARQWGQGNEFKAQPDSRTAPAEIMWT